MRKILLVLFMLPLLVLSAASREAETKLNRCLEKIHALPEAINLLNEIKQEGNIRFALNEDHEAAKFGAFWDLDSRMICVNPHFHSNEGAMIGSLLFEMQNAKVSKEFHELFERAERGEIAREPYIRAVEFIEFKNSKRASEMAHAGIKRGLFPNTAALFTYRDFDEHFYYQQVGGHSDIIGKMYDRIAPKNYR